MPQILPELPYRGMKSFRFLDRNIYAGRDIEIQKITKLLLLYRGLLIYGATGVGKSSLMNAGVLPALLEDDFQPEVIRLNPDLNGTFVVSKIRKNKTEYLPSIFEHFREADATDSRKINVSFTGFKETLRQLDLRNRQTNSNDTLLPPADRSVVLIFDQFEELITLFEEDTRYQVNLKKRLQLQNLVVQLLTRCYFSQTLPVKLVFVFREDYLAKFARLFKAIPDLKDHYLRIKPMQTDQVYSIVHRPFDDAEKQQHFPNPFSPEFSNNICVKMLDQYPDGNLDLTEVQIVCLQLYNLPTPTEREAMLRDHTVADILQNFYLDLLNNIDEKERPVAIDILSLLVLNEKTRNIFHQEAIVHHLPQYPPAVVEAAIDKLENTIKVIRREIRQGGIYYEIVSEAMIPYINKKKIEKEKEEERLEQAKTERIERRARMKVKRRLLLLGSLVLFLLLAVYGFMRFNEIATEKKKAAIIEREKKWLEKISTEALRNSILAMLMKLNINDSSNRTMSRSFAIAADSYDYIKSRQYKSALSAAFIGYMVNKNAITEKILEERLQSSIMPFQQVGFPESDSAADDMDNLLAGKNGFYFLVFANNRVQVRNYLDSNIAYTLSLFESAIAPDYPRMRFNYARIYTRVALAVVPANGSQYRHILYASNGFCLLNEQGWPVQAYRMPIALITALDKNRFLLVSGKGQGTVYDIQQNAVRAVKHMQLPGTGDGDFRPRVLSNNHYFINRNTLYYLDASGNITTKKMNDAESLIDVNRQSLLLLAAEKNSKNKIRSERNVAELPGLPVASLAADTGMAVTCYFDKAYTIRLTAQPNNIQQDTAVINDLQDNFTPYISPRGHYILFKNYPDMYTVYNTASTQKHFLFVNMAGSPGYTQYAAAFATGNVFLSDSVVAIYNFSGVKLYNLHRTKPFSNTKERDEWLADNSLQLYPKFAGDLDSSALAYHFKRQYLEHELAKAYSTRNYEWTIQLAHQLLATRPDVNRQLACYEHLYNAYYNLMLNLGTDAIKAATQLDYARIMARYADTMLAISQQPDTYNNLRSKTLGSVAWYLLLNRLYAHALDTCRLALSLDSGQQQQQWIHTNLALSYLFNHQPAEAFKVYNTWKNRYFNDDLALARQRFEEDIQTLTNDYKMSIPYLDSVKAVLKKAN